MIANTRIEQMSRREMEVLQLERLQKTLQWANTKSAFYQQKFREAGVSHEDFQSLEDLRRFPFLQATELRQVDSLDVLTIPLSGVLRFNHMQEPFGEITKLYTNGNNTNNRAFNDLSGSMMQGMRGGGGGMGRGQGGWGRGNGISTSYMGGVNGAWSLFEDKMDLGANYLYNHTSRDVTEHSSKRVYQEGTGNDLLYQTEGFSKFCQPLYITNGLKIPLAHNHTANLTVGQVFSYEG